MVNISKIGDSTIKFTFTDNDRYLYNGEITLPLNSLILEFDTSDLVIFKKIDGDVFVTFLLENSNFNSKDELIAWYKANMVSSGGGGGGVTPEEVEEMINEAVSGKANSSDVYTTGQTSGATQISNALNAKQNTLVAGDNITISGNVISSQGGGCEVEETLVYDRITGGYADSDGKTKASFVILDYLGDKSTGSYQLAFIVGDNYNDYTNAYIYFDYPNHSSSSTDTGITEYLTVEYVNDIQDFKVTIKPVYQSSVWIKQVYNVGFDMNLLVPFYTINSGSPCTVITTDIVGLVTKVKSIADKSVNYAYLNSDKNALAFNYGINSGGGNSYYVNLKEIDGSNNTLKPDIRVGTGVSGWTEVNLSEGGTCDLTGSNVKGFTTFRISGDTTQVNNWNLNIAVGYNGNYTWDSVLWDSTENTFVLNVDWSDIFSAATATWDSNTGYLTVSYPQTVTVDGEERQTEFYYINSQSCQYGYAISKLEYYAELQQPLKPYVQALRTDVNTISGQVATKQDTLIAGSNITISGNVISATGGGGGSSYTAGDGIDITNDVISVTGKVDTSTYSAYTAATDTALASKQTTLTAGTGISIVDNVISATGGGGSSYSAGTGIDITNDVISVTGMVETSAVTSAVTSGSTDVLTSGGAYEALGGLKLVKLTESEYTALVTKDSNTLYVVIPDPPTPSGIPFDNTLVGQTIPTSFKILKSELDAVTSNDFGCLADDYTTQLTIVPGESNNRKYYLYNEDDGTVYGTVVEEGDYYVFSHNITEFPTIALVTAPNSPVNLIID